jgi:DNA-binding CsgD family transcriptional regulator
VTPSPGRLEAEIREGDWPGRDHGLSARESEVLCLIAQGLSNQEIADRAFLSINSVKTYIRSAYRKIGVERRTRRCCGRPATASCRARRGSSSAIRRRPLTRSGRRARRRAGRRPRGDRQRGPRRRATAAPHGPHLPARVPGPVRRGAGPGALAVARG